MEIRSLPIGAERVRFNIRWQVQFRRTNKPGGYIDTYTMGNPRAEKPS